MLLFIFSSTFAGEGVPLAADNPPQPPPAPPPPAAAPPAPAPPPPPPVSSTGPPATGASEEGTAETQDEPSDLSQEDGKKSSLRRLFMGKSSIKVDDAVANILEITDRLLPGDLLDLRANKSTLTLAIKQAYKEDNKQPLMTIFSSAVVAGLITNPEYQIDDFTESFLDALPGDANGQNTGDDKVKKALVEDLDNLAEKMKKKFSSADLKDEVTKPPKVTRHHLSALLKGSQPESSVRSLTPEAKELFYFVKAAKNEISHPIRTGRSVATRMLMLADGNDNTVKLTKDREGNYIYAVNGEEHKFYNGKQMRSSTIFPTDPIIVDGKQVTGVPLTHDQKVRAIEERGGGGGIKMFILGGEGPNEVPESLFGNRVALGYSMKIDGKLQRVTLRYSFDNEGKLKVDMASPKGVTLTPKELEKVIRRSPIEGPGAAIIRSRALALVTEKYKSDISGKFKIGEDSLQEDGYGRSTREEAGRGEESGPDAAARDSTSGASADSDSRSQTPQLHRGSGTRYNLSNPPPDWTKLIGKLRPIGTDGTRDTNPLTTKEVVDTLKAEPDLYKDALGLLAVAPDCFVDQDEVRTGIAAELREQKTKSDEDEKKLYTEHERLMQEKAQLGDQVKVQIGVINSKITLGVGAGTVDNDIHPEFHTARRSSGHTTKEQLEKSVGANKEETDRILGSINGEFFVDVGTKVREAMEKVAVASKEEGVSSTAGRLAETSDYLLSALKQLAPKEADSSSAAEQLSSINDKEKLTRLVAAQTIIKDIRSFNINAGAQGALRNQLGRIDSSLTALKGQLTAEISELTQQLGEDAAAAAAAGAERGDQAIEAVKAAQGEAQGASRS